MMSLQRSSPASAVDARPSPTRLDAIWGAWCKAVGWTVKEKARRQYSFARKKPGIRPRPAKTGQGRRLKLEIEEDALLVATGLFTRAYAMNYWEAMELGSRIPGQIRPLSSRIPPDIATFLDRIAFAPPGETYSVNGKSRFSSHSEGFTDALATLGSVERLSGDGIVHGASG